MSREHEAAAEIIHGAMVWAASKANDGGGPKPWQGGNSDAEYEARRAAAKIAALPPAQPVQQTMQARVAELAQKLSKAEREALLARSSRQPGVTVSLSIKGLTHHSQAEDGLSSILQPTPLGLLVVQQLEQV